MIHMPVSQKRTQPEVKTSAPIKAAAIGGALLLALTSCAANEGGTTDDDNAFQGAFRDIDFHIDSTLSQFKLQFCQSIVGPIGDGR